VRTHDLDRLVEPKHVHDELLQISPKQADRNAAVRPRIESVAQIEIEAACLRAADVYEWARDVEKRAGVGNAGRSLSSRVNVVWGAGGRR
jgi:hypothetical protein